MDKKLHVVSIEETPTTYSKGAGNRPGWFSYPGSQYLVLSDGSQRRVPHGMTPKAFAQECGASMRPLQRKLMRECALRWTACRKEFNRLGYYPDTHSGTTSSASLQFAILYRDLSLS
jgi:hypothetical protein